MFRTCPVQHIKEAQPYISQNAELSRCVWLPQYPEAKILLDKFIQDIEHIHHVTHCPSLLGILDEVYACLNQQGQVKPGAMILLLSIFASSTNSWVQQDCERGLFSTSAEANSQTPMWIKATEDVLDIAHRTARVSIEGIQGIIIVFFVLGNLEGISRRCRSLYSMCFLLARELGLHCLDHPSKTHLANSAQAEIGRRVWWYLAASDWFVPVSLLHSAQTHSIHFRAIAARLGGEAQGAYQCHLRQMMVKKPLNINDEELVDGMSLTEQPLSQPTAMSYSLQRLRLSEISRRIVDRTPLVMGQTSSPSHDVVMDIDTELQMLINDIPPFFSMSQADLIQIYRLDSSQAVKIAHQGYMHHSLLYAQRCKLHFPNFTRGYVDCAYASSRDICLQSAHLIIRTETQLETSGLCIATRFKLLGLLVSVFMACIIVLMDLCHNKSSSQQEERRAEVVDAFRILEEARHESETAARFLDGLMHVLRKHKVSPPNHHSGGEQSPRHRIGDEKLPTTAAAVASNLSSTSQSYAEPTTLGNAQRVLGSNETNGINNVAGDSFANVEEFPSYFDEFAQSFEQGIDAGSIDWNNFLSEFDVM